MDKYEYRLKIDQIKQLIADKDYNTAAQIAHTVNWRRVKSVGGLYMAGKIYEYSKQYKKSREIFLMAYDRSPSGRKILYHLTNVALKLQNLKEAEEYYQEFAQIAPHDNQKYILEYQIAKAKGESLEKRIAILEQLKDREYIEEWLFELANLYHKANDGEKCVEICDDLVLWFGEGKHVEKAFELKILHQGLTDAQKEKYKLLLENREHSLNKDHSLQKEMVNSETENSGLPEGQEEKEAQVELQPQSRRSEATIKNPRPRRREAAKKEPVQPPQLNKKEDDFPQISFDESRFSTANLQAELAKNMRQIMTATDPEAVSHTMEVVKELVKDIPYLHLPAEEERGQDQVHEQISGQISLDDILVDIKSHQTENIQVENIHVKNKELGDVVAKALRDTGQLLEQLGDAMPKADPEDKVDSGEAKREDALGHDQEEEAGKAEEAGQPEETVQEEGACLADPKEEWKELFSDFIPISGMEEQIQRALEGSQEKKKDDSSSCAGNILIIGGQKSGKTMLATQMTKALQKAMHSNGKLGKISADKLNHKDLAKMFQILSGGFLLIENAGNLLYETATRLSLMMEQDTGGLLIILEDTSAGIKAALSKDANFAEKFTEKVRIPILTSDELVHFAKHYAHEKNHVIDDVGVLAVYDSIHKIEKPDEAVTLADVASIIDKAIGRKKKGGVRKLIDRRRQTKDGFILIREKDFEN